MRKIILGIMVAAFSALSASAALVVDFGWGSKGGNVTARDPDNITPLGTTWNFSDTQKLIASAKGKNATVYGGIAASWTTEQTNSFIPDIKLASKTPGIHVQVDPGAPESKATAVKGILIWGKADFQNGMNANMLGFIPGNTLIADVGFMAKRAEFRFVVNQGGVYYVSNTKSTVAGVFMIDPTATLWRTISTDNKYTIGEKAVPLSHNDIQAVGIYMSGTRETGVMTRTVMDIKSFAVEATPVAILD